MRASRHARKSGSGDCRQQASGGFVEGRRAVLLRNPDIGAGDGGPSLVPAGFCSETLYLRVDPRRVAANRLCCTLLPIGGFMFVSQWLRVGI